MKRIGKTDGGGVLVELTNADVVRLMEACQALDQLFGEIEVGMPVTLDGAPGRVTKVEGDRVEFTAVKRIAKNAKRIAKAQAKRASVPPSKRRKPALPARKCEACGKVFVPWRNDQRCCNKACRAAKFAADRKSKRLEALKRLDKRGTFRPHDDVVPAELKQAQREASQE